MSQDQVLPWDNRSQLGISEALISTIRLLCTAPADAFGRIRPNGDLVGPLLFGLLLSWLGVIISMAWSVLLSGATTAITGDLGTAGLTAGVGVAQALFVSVVWPVIYLLGVFLSSGIYQLGLMVVSGLDNSEHGFEGTVKVVCYSAVSNVAQVVPWLGSLVALIGMVVLLVIGFVSVHRTSQGKAAAGVFIPLIFCCVCGAILSIMFSAGIAAFIASQGG